MEKEYIVKSNIKFKIYTYVYDVVRHDMELFNISLQKLCNEIILKCCYMVLDDKIYDMFHIESMTTIQFALNKDHEKIYQNIIRKNKNRSESFTLRQIFIRYACMPLFIREYIVLHDKVEYLRAAAKTHKTITVLYKDGACCDGDVMDVYM